MLQHLAAVDVASARGDGRAMVVARCRCCRSLGFLINGALSLVRAYTPGPADPSAAHGDARCTAMRTRAHAGGTARTATIITWSRATRYAALVSIVGPLRARARSRWRSRSGWRCRASATCTTPYVRRTSTGCGRRPADRRWAFQVDQLSMVMVLVDHGRRHADPHLQRRLHARRPGVPAVLRVPESVRRLHARAGARRELPGACSSAGKAWALLLSADRLLVQR